MLPLVGKPASVGETFLFVFDFDDTIIRGNSDELIPKALGVEDEMKAAYFNPMGRPQWTNLLSNTMSSFTKEDVANIIPKALKMEPAMQELFNLLERVRKTPAPVLVETPKSGIQRQLFGTNTVDVPAVPITASDYLNEVIPKPIPRDPLHFRPSTTATTTTTSNRLRPFADITSQSASQRNVYNSSVNNDNTVTNTLRDSWCDPARSDVTDPAGTRRFWGLRGEISEK